MTLFKNLSLFQNLFFKAIFKFCTTKRLFGKRIAIFMFYMKLKEFVLLNPSSKGGA